MILRIIWVLFLIPGALLAQEQGCAEARQLKAQYETSRTSFDSSKAAQGAREQANAAVTQAQATEKEKLTAKADAGKAHQETVKAKDQAKAKAEQAKQKALQLQQEVQELQATATQTEPTADGAGTQPSAAAQAAQAQLAAKQTELQTAQQEQQTAETDLKDKESKEKEAKSKLDEATKAHDAARKDTEAKTKAYDAAKTAEDTAYKTEKSSVDTLVSMTESLGVIAQRCQSEAFTPASLALPSTTGGTAAAPATDPQLALFGGGTAPDKKGTDGAAAGFGDFTAAAKSFQDGVGSRQSSALEARGQADQQLAQGREQLAQAEMDRRGDLRPAMSGDEARAVLQQVAAGQRPPESSIYQARDVLLGQQRDGIGQSGDEKLMGAITGYEAPKDAISPLDFIGPGAVGKGLVTSVGKGVSTVKGLLTGSADDVVRAGTQTAAAPTWTAATKIKDQMTPRGWTDDLVNNYLAKPVETRATRDLRFQPGSTTKVDQGPATVYYGKDGHYVIRNDRTGDIVQVSKRSDSGWVDPFGQVVRPR